MRELTPTQEAERIERGNAVAFFLAIEWAGGARYYTERASFNPDPATIAGADVEATVLEFPTAARAIDLGHKAPIQVSQAQAVIQGAVDLASRLRFQEPKGRWVKFYAIFLTDSDPVEADWTLLQSYAIDDYEVNPSGDVALSLVDWVGPILERRPMKAIAAAAFPDAPDRAFGQIMPYVFGRVEDCPCIRVTGGRVTQLRSTVDADELTLPVLDATRFLEAGVLPCAVRIADENIFVAEASVADGSHTLTVTNVNGRGYGGTTAVEHSAGEEVRQVLGGGADWAERYEFLVCRGVATTVERVRISDIALAPTDYAVIQVDQDGDGEAETYIQLAGQLPSRGEASGGQAQETWAGSTGGWSVNGGNATRSADAIDEDEQTAHNSYAEVTTGTGHDYLCLRNSASAGGRSEMLDSAALEIDYAVAPGGSKSAPSDTVPWGSAEVSIWRQGGKIISRNLRKPNEDEFRTYLDLVRGQVLSPTAGTLNDSKPLFTETAVSKSLLDCLAAYLSGFSSYSFTDNDADPVTTIRAVAWGTVRDQGPSGEHFAVTDYWYPPGEGVLPNWMIDNVHASSVVRVLALRPFAPPAANYGVVIKSLRVHFLARAAGWVMSYETTSTGQQNLFEGWYGSIPTSTNITLKVVSSKGTWTKNFTLGSVFGACMFDIDVSGKNFTPSDLAATEVQINGATANFKIRDPLLMYEPPTVLAGQGTSLSGALDDLLGAQSVATTERRTMRISLNAYIAAHMPSNPWSFFDGTFNAWVVASGNFGGTRIFIFDVRLVVVSSQVIQKTLTEDEAVFALADITGFNVAKPSEAIGRMATGVEFLALDVAEVDSVSLSAAVDDTWALARRLDGDDSLGDMLSALCRDAGIVAVWESGRLRFMRHDNGVTMSTDLTLDRSEMFAVTERRLSTPTSVFNDLGLYYKRRYDLSDQRFGAVVNRVSGPSQMEPWGAIRETYDAEWIRDPVTAAALAQRMLNRSCWRLALGVAEGPLKWLHAEAADSALLVDADAGFAGASGRIVGAEFISPATVRLATLVGADRQTIWAGTAGTYVAVIFGVGLVFVVNGVLVAILGPDAVWRLRGQIIETTQEFTAPRLLSLGPGGSIMVARHRTTPTDYWASALQFKANGDMWIGPKFATALYYLKESDFWPWALPSPLPDYIYENEGQVGLTIDLVRLHTWVYGLPDMEGAVLGCREIREQQSL